ncbi:hypothetical protein Tco_0055733 [Tanacetum coccineum]
MCVVTRMDDFIMETFKIIIKGNVFAIRAWELIGWDPDFIEEESEEGSEEEDKGIKDSSPYTDNCLGIHSTGEQLDDMLQEHKQSTGYKSDDPFGIYDILHKEELAKDNKKEHETTDDPSHPPGFTNSVEEPKKVNEQEDIYGMEEGSENVLKHGNKSVTQMMGSGIKKTTSVGSKFGSEWTSSTGCIIFVKQIE